jgi:DNA repair exonuclease SbcCD ATPase subunit
MSELKFKTRLEKLQEQIQMHSNRQMIIQEKLVKYGSIMPEESLRKYQREYRELQRFINRLVSEIDFINSQYI